MEILKVSTKSSPNKVAGAIVGSLKKNGKVEVQAIGAGAVNQASKALAIARRFLEQEKLDLYAVPAFIEIKIGEEMRTGISFKIYLKENK
ncbi:stage V sporulation protein S [Fervidobacterium thailandense]|uniref:Stage V sporulation protein S n=1 Tax=Fervidobacterium thailandense TaxID=1008305 RepID=A0A1E3G1B9_9BACT|nr:stage V sporulation protein S [Fervidobacterium thailandense]ODN30037.1 stage V sporulation protein S [Fervidobacterium thailandense]